MSRRATLRLLLLGLLLCWCGVFLRSENTEKSIVRALLLEQTPEQWNVALLYQFPEAAADSSDAAASVQLCAGTGKTLEQALFAAEEHLPQRPSYRLCEYLFLNTGSLRGEISACEPLFCERADLRLATRVLAVTPGCEELLARAAPLLEYGDAMPPRRGDARRHESGRAGADDGDASGRRISHW